MFRDSRSISVLGLTGLVVAGLLLSISATASSAEAASPDQSGRANRVPYTHDMKVLFEEMTLVQLLWEQTGYARTRCVGNGLNNVEPLTEGPMILIPNAGDLAAGGSNVSIKLSPDGKITFIPRVPGQRIRVPMDVGGKREGEEVLSLSLDEAMQLMSAGKLAWTAKDKGPYRNGHGLPGHIAICDPWYNEPLYQHWEQD